MYEVFTSSLTFKVGFDPLAFILIHQVNLDFLKKIPVFRYQVHSISIWNADKIPTSI